CNASCGEYFWLIACLPASGTLPELKNQQAISATIYTVNDRPQHPGTLHQTGVAAHRPCWHHGIWYRREYDRPRPVPDSCCGSCAGWLRMPGYDGRTSPERWSIRVLSCATYSSSAEYSPSAQVL